MAKKTKEPVGEPITDILETFFKEDGVEMVKKVFMSGDKVIKEEVEKI